MSKSSYARINNQSSIHLANVITITSETAVGSSTTMNHLQQHLGCMLWRYVSGGSIMRSFARDLEMTIDQFAAFNREHPEERYDDRCDQAVAIYAEHSHTLIEGRLPHAFVAHGFHVRLVCPVAVRAKRRHDNEPGSVLSEVLERIKQRDSNDNERYSTLYPDCIWPDEDFDLVISTEILSPTEVARQIIEGHQQWVKKVNAKSWTTIRG